MERWSVSLGIMEGHDAWDRKTRLRPEIINSEQNPRLLDEETLLNLIRFQHTPEGIHPVPDPVLSEIPDNATATNVVFDNLARLEGYDLSEMTVHPGDFLNFTLYWRALEETDANYTIFTQLLGPDMLLHGQHDSRPAYGTIPTNRWKKGQLVPDEHYFVIDQHAPDGEYQLLIGFYNPENGARLPSADNSDDFYIIPITLKSK
jgi:hypothetical protein